MTASVPAEGPTRVLWLIKGLGPGGAEQLLVSSARVADHSRFAYRAAFVRPDKSQLVPALEAAGVSCQRLGAGRTGWFGWLADLRDQMAVSDVVHSHSPLLAGVARLVARTLPRGKRPITVSTEHNMWGNFALPTRLLNALTASLDDRRWAVSEQVRRSMWRPWRGGAQVLIHGIVHDEPDLGEKDPSAEDTRARVRRGLGIADDTVIALTAANLRREKDYPNLLHATALVVTQDPHLTVLAAGQGPLEADVTALHHELGLGDRFRLLGYRPDVPDLMAAADFFVLGSAFEGLPVSIMEAMAAGLPVVATAVGGVPEAVLDGETGLLVPPHDASALAAAMVTVARSPELRERLGSAAAERSRIFDIRAAVTEEEQAYAELGRQQVRRRTTSSVTAGSRDA